MRIHLLVRSLKDGGAGSHLNAISYIRYLKEVGHTVTVHAISSFSNPPADIAIINHAKENLGFIAGNDFITKLLFAHEKDADIFFLYGVDCIWGAGKYKKRGGSVPVAVYLDTCLSSMNTGQRLSTSYYLKRVFWEKLFGMRDAAWVDAYIAASPFIKETYVRAGFPQEKFYIVSNFFEFDEKYTASQQTPSPIVRMLYAGRLTYDKGTDLLIEALRNLSADIPWQLRIVGDGPLQKECESMIHAYKLGKRVEITPWVDQAELQKIYTSTDIFIHPSRCPEAFGRTFVEAMSHGIPIIASNIGAAPWTIGEAGIFFSRDNTSELTNAIRTLITDAKLRKRLGEEGIQQSRKFNKEIIGSHLASVLDDILGAGNKA